MALLVVTVICTLVTLIVRFPSVDDALAQLVIAFKRMRPDGRVAHTGIIRQCHRQRGFAPFRAALSFEDLAYRVMVWDVLLYRFADGLLQTGAPELFQQSQQPRGDRAEIGAALGEKSQQIPAGRPRWSIA